MINSSNGSPWRGMLSVLLLLLLCISHHVNTTNPVTTARNIRVICNLHLCSTDRYISVPVSGTSQHTTNTSTALYRTLPLRKTQTYLHGRSRGRNATNIPIRSTKIRAQRSTRGSRALSMSGASQGSYSEVGLNCTPR